MMTGKAEKQAAHKQRVEQRRLKEMVGTSPMHHSRLVTSDDVREELSATIDISAIYMELREAMNDFVIMPTYRWKKYLTGSIEPLCPSLFIDIVYEHSSDVIEKTTIFSTFKARTIEMDCNVVYDGIESWQPPIKVTLSSGYFYRGMVCQNCNLLSLTYNPYFAALYTFQCFNTETKWKIKRI